MNAMPLKQDTPLIIARSNRVDGKPLIGVKHRFSIGDVVWAGCDHSGKSMFALVRGQPDAHRRSDNWSKADDVSWNEIELYTPTYFIGIENKPEHPGIICGPYTTLPIVSPGKSVWVHEGGKYFLVYSAPRMT